MSLYQYSSAPLALNTTRLLRLRPHCSNNGPIKCELFDYILSETSSGKHLYEALSYAWISGERSESIILNNCVFLITKNLHVALLHLRDHHLERFLWVDAICINQDDNRDKEKQIPLMRTIYAKAERVIVWLGPSKDVGNYRGDEALKVVRQIAQDKALKNGPSDFQNQSLQYNLCLNLLQRDWFQRIWVLQEVGVARCISVMCGSVELNGRAFCEGIAGLKLPVALRNLIRPINDLIREANFRANYGLDFHATLSIAELMDKYRSHKATKQHDKIYAVLGLSTDDPNTPALKPNYNQAWNQVFKQVAAYIFPDNCILDFAQDKASVTVKGKGQIIGVIKSVEEDNGEEGSTSSTGFQLVNICFKQTAQSSAFEKEWGSQWLLHNSAMAIQECDLLCVLQGAAKPSIIRLCSDHFTLVMTTVTAKQNRLKEPFDPRKFEKNHVHDLVLTWELPSTDSDIVTRQSAESIFRAQKYSTELSEGAKDLPHVRPIVAELFREIPWLGAQATVRLLNQAGPFITDLVKAVVENTQIDAAETTELLFKHQEKNLPVSEEIVRAAAGNTGHDAAKIMELLFEYHGKDLPISEEIVRTTAGNTGHDAAKIMELLFEYHGKDLPVSEEVVRVAAENTGFYARMIIECLYKYRGEKLPCSPKVVEAAAGNTGHFAPAITKLLFMHHGKNVLYSEKAVRAAVGNTGPDAGKIIELLFKHYGKNLPISEELVRAAAGNAGICTTIIMEHLLEYQGKNLQISEDIIKAAVGNTGFVAAKTIKLLFKYGGKSLPVSEEIASITAGNTGQDAGEIMELLIQYYGKDLPVSEGVVKTAAGNNGRDVKRILKVLLQYQGQNLRISEDIIKAASGNTGHDATKIMELLFKHQKKIYQFLKR